MNCIKEQIIRLTLSDAIPEERLKNALECLLGKPSMEKGPMFVSEKDALKLLGNITRTTIWHLCKKGKLNKYHVGGRSLYKVDEIEMMVTQSLEK